MHDDIAFVQVRQELGPEPGCKQAAARDQGDRDADGQPAETQCRGKQGPIREAGAGDKRVPAVPDRLAEQERNGRRHKGDGQHHGAQERNHHGRGHGMKHLAFHARQGKDRNVDCRDDADAEQRRADDFAGGLADGFQPFLQRLRAAGSRFAQPPQAVLDDDDRAVHDQPEVQCPQAHEVGADPALHHAGDGHQHGQRNDRGGEQGGAHVAQQQEQHHDDQQRALQKVGPYRGQRLVDQFGAVVDRGRRDPGRQARLNFFQPVGHGAGDRAAVLTDEHEHGAHHHFAAVLGGRARTKLAADSDRGDIPDPDGYAVALADHHLGQVLHFLRTARDPQQPLRAVVLDEPCAAVVVVLPETVEHVGVGHPVGQQPGRVRRHQDFLLEAAHGTDLDHSGDAQELRADDPVVHGSEVGGRHRCSVGVERAGLGVHREHENLAQTGCNGAEGGFEPGGKRRSRRVQPFPHLLAGEIDVGPFLEHDRDLREPVAGQRPCVVQQRQSRHGVLDGKTHPLFHFQRRITGGGRIDGDLYIGDVGYRVNGQAREIPRTENPGQQDQHHDQPSLPDGKAKNRFEHGPLPGQ